MNPESQAIANQYKINPRTMDKADIANRQSAYKGAKQVYWGNELKKAKKKSDFYGSKMGIASKMPGAMKDTVMKVLKGKATK